MILDEIYVQSAIIETLAPLLAEDLGVLVAPNGQETTTPAFYQDGDETPSATYPRIGVSFNGDSTPFVTQVVSVQEDNPLFGQPDEPEFLYYLDRYYHTEFSLSMVSDNGAMQEVLTGNRKSASYIMRKVRALLGRESVRKTLRTFGIGVDYLGVATPQVDLDSVVIKGTSVMTMNFTYMSIDREKVTGLVDRVVSSGELKRIDDTDPNPIPVDTDTGFVG